MNHSKVSTNEVNGMFFTEYGVNVQIKNSNHLYRFSNWSDGDKSMDRKMT